MPCRTAASWGNLGDASKVLVQSALEDPLNQRFVMTSDSDVPLYPAPALWLQLTQEQASRVDACNADQVGAAQRSCLIVACHRGRPRVAWAPLPPSEPAAPLPLKVKTLVMKASGTLIVSPLMFSGRLKPAHWRKSSQWSMLIRRHAELMAQDFEVDAAFRRHCYVGHDNLRCRGSWCVADEHYPATLLSFYNETGSCACSAGLEGGSTTPTYARWDAESDHPYSFKISEVTLGLLDSIRLDRCSGETERRPARTHTQFLLLFLKHNLKPLLLRFEQLKSQPTMVAAGLILTVLD